MCLNKKILLTLSLVIQGARAQELSDLNLAEASRQERQSSQHLIVGSLGVASLVASGLLQVANRDTLQEAERIVRQRARIFEIERTYNNLVLERELGETGLTTAAHERRLRDLEAELAHQRLQMGDAALRFTHRNDYQALARARARLMEDVVFNARYADIPTTVAAQSVAERVRKAKFLRRMSALGLGAGVGLSLWSLTGFANDSSTSTDEARLENEFSHLEDDLNRETH
jgi:hypothetical protein